MSDDTDTVRRCQKCGEPTGGEEAWIQGQIWCHPCADALEADAMSDDIVKRLRDEIDVDANEPIDRLMDEAADEIERLRRTLQLHAGDVASLSGELDEWRERALAAEAELSSFIKEG